jgi:REase_DpnII-MboI
MRSKTATIEELTRSAGELQEFLAQVEDLGREGFPYLDAARARTELQFRECIRRTFGEKSQEFQEHCQHKLLMDSPEETRQSIVLIKTLIATLEQKKLDLQGGPPRQQIPVTSPVTLMSTRPQMTLVQTGPIVPPPVVMAVAMTTNFDLAPATVVPSSSTVPPVPLASSKNPELLSTSPPPPAPSPNPQAPIAAAMPHISPQPVAQIAPDPQLPPSQAAQSTQADVSHAVRPPQPPRSEPEPNVDTTPSASSQPKMQEAPTVPQSLQPHPSVPTGSSLHQEPMTQSPQSGSGSVEFVKTLCGRFHFVARQLRLRGEYRATLSVEDDFDAQDLLHALLRIQFDDIGTDEWMPSYSDGALRTTFLLNNSRLAVIIKKTRPGLNAKDLTEQLRIDAERYRSHSRCTALLCFMYDPEGRIGNPRGLETSLKSVNDSFAIDVLVAPK